jgi:hypothetical protein
VCENRTKLEAGELEKQHGDIIHVKVESVGDRLILNSIIHVIQQHQGLEPQFPSHLTALLSLKNIFSKTLQTM